MDSTSSAGTPQGRGRGRGRGRGHNQTAGNSNQGSEGQHHQQHQEEHQQAPSQTRGRNRGRGRGRGGRGGHVPLSPENNIPPSSARPPGGSFGARLTETAPTSTDLSQDDVKQKSIQRRVSIGTEDSEVCFICASPISHLAIAPCNHQTCHICSLRMRALYKTRACAHCRTESPFVIFTDSAEKRYQDFVETDFAKSDSNLGINYEKTEILEDTILLLRYNCPDADCDTACLGWPDLHRHVRSKHDKVMCDLCTRNKKVFTHEHELFTQAQLRKHQKYGDDNPGAVDQSGFKGHPECGFCRQRFYGDDELYTHCREKHERCHICDRRNGGRNPQYYLNYAELEKHFAAEHFVCLDAECQANKTNVFDSEMDLKAHQLAEHPNGLSKDARRDVRLISLSGFDQLRAPYQPQRSGGGHREREGRGAGRGRDPNADPLPLSSAQPQSRAELAFQRQLAIQSASSVAPRTFGGQLSQPSTSSTSTSRQTPVRPANSAPIAETSPLPDFGNLTIDPATLSPADRAKHARHQAVTERALKLMKNNPTKLEQFRKNVSSYRTGALTAPDLIEACFSLFDCPSAEMGILVRELADLYEDEGKKQSLLAAWNSWRSINEDYPSLPGPSGTGLPGLSNSTGSYSGAISSQTSANLASSLGANVASGRRVLKLKSSTAQSRNAASSAAATRALNNLEAFPALGASNARSQGHAAQTWGGSTYMPQVTNTRLSIAPQSASSVPGTASASTSKKAALPPTMSQRQNETLFPSLPKAAKPNVMISGFNTRGSGRLSGPNSGANTPKPNAWSAAPTPGEAHAALDAVAAAQNENSNTGATAPAKGKKKNKERKTLNLREYLS